MKSNTLNSKRASDKDALFLNILDKIVLLIIVAAVLFFILYPLLCIVRQSFGGREGFSLAAYEKVYKNIRLLKNSVFVAVLTACFSTMLALAVALCIRFSGRWLGRILMGILMVSMVSPPFVASLAYIQLFGRNGFITKRLLGISANPYGWQGVVMMETLFFAALSALLLVATLEKLDVSLTQASADLGAKPGYTLLHIVFPLLRPALAICFLLSFIRSMSDFGTPIVIGGRFDTVATEIYLQIIGYADLDLAAALNMLLFVPTIFVFILYRRLLERSDSMFVANEARKVGKEEEFRLRGPFGFFISAIGALYFVVVCMEYFSIFLSSFSKNMRGKQVLTTEYLEAFLDRSMDSIIRSVEYGLIVALLGTLLGTLISYYVEWRKIRCRGILDFIVTLPYMLPGSCFGIAYILAFNKAPLKLTGTGIIVVANIIFKQISITTKSSTACLAQINRNLDDAARDLGAHPMRVLTDVLIPNLRPAFMAGFIQNFTNAMITSGAVLFLVSPGKKLAVFTLFDCINSGKYGEASIIASVLIVITVFVNVVFTFFVTGREKKHVS